MNTFIHIFHTYSAGFKHSLSDIVDEQKNYITHPNKSITTTTASYPVVGSVIVPATKTNGFDFTTTTQQARIPATQLKQQIEYISDLPVPAPRRSNSIPLGDGIDSTQNGNSQSATSSSDSAHESQVIYDFHSFQLVLI